MQIYLIGSLRNLEIPNVAKRLRNYGFDVFDDWWSASPDADDWWQEHERGKGKTYAEALAGPHAECVFDFDFKHISRSDIGVLVLPAGKSGHLELGYMIGTGKPGYILFDQEPERYDVMYKFAKGVFFNVDELGQHLEREYIRNPFYDRLG